MHELSVVASLYEIMEKKATEQKANKITRVRVQVGVLSGVVPEFLESAFDIYKKDTMASEATLEMDIIPVKIRCKNCRAETTSEEPVFICSRCGSHEIETVDGTELILERLELQISPDSQDSPDSLDSRDKPD